MAMIIAIDGGMVDWQPPNAEERSAARKGGGTRLSKYMARAAKI